MKKIMFALAALIAMTVSAGSASAQVIASAPTGGCSTCAQGAPSYAGAYGQPYAGHGHSLGLPHLGGHMHNPTYGFHPAFGRIMDSHRTLFDRIAGVGRNVPNGPTMEAAQGGTLVFPQNPYIRSPRDFFMWEAK